jgi:hypothetical protein
MTDNPNDKMKRLSALASAYPAMDAQAAAREKAALDIQAGQAIASTQPTGNIRAAGQQIAGALTQAQGNAAVAQQQQSQKNLSQIGQMAVAEQQTQAETEIANKARQQNENLARAGITSQMATQKADIASRKTLTDADIATKQRMEAAGLVYDTRLNALTLKQREDLSKLGRDIKDELFDKNLAFEKDEVGRKFSNERQLADYAVSRAKSDIDLQKSMAAMQRAAKFEIIMLEAAQKKIVQELEQQSANATREMGQEDRIKLAQYKSSIEKRIARKKAEAANRAMIFQGVGMVVGAGIAIGMGAPSAAPAMAQIGGNLGQTTAGATE